MATLAAHKVCGPGLPAGGPPLVPGEVRPHRGALPRGLFCKPPEAGQTGAEPGLTHPGQVPG